MKTLWCLSAAVTRPAAIRGPVVQLPARPHQPMKPQRLVYHPTRSRRLNEMLGLSLLVAAGLLTLSLLTYSPEDPSMNTVGGTTGLHPAQNWTGLVGAYTSDLLLQALGVAVFLLPMLLLRIGISWMRSRSIGSGSTKFVGILLWLVFAPAAIALFPGHLLWHRALPLMGVEGQVVGEAMVHFVNFPGAVILCALMVALSLYLVTTFTLVSSREWWAEHFAPIRNIHERYLSWREARATRRLGSLPEAPERRAIPSWKEQASARAQGGREEVTSSAIVPSRSTSLLSSFLGLFRRKKVTADDLSILPHDDRASFGAEPPSVWQSLPRTMVDEVPASSLNAAAAAAAPFAAELAAAAAPLRSAVASAAELPFSPPQGSSNTSEDAPIDQPSSDDFSWLDAPTHTSLEIPSPRSHGEVRAADLPELPAARLPATPLQPASQLVPQPGPQLVPRSAAPQPMPPMPSPMADLRDQNIAFGRRADADMRPVVMTAKSVRGYKLPPSTLLYKSEEHAQAREEELLEEARVLVEKCGEFGVDGQVTQINPGPVVTTFEFKPDSGVKYSRVTGLADDLCLAMAAESILIERMAGKSTVGIQVPNHNRETIWLRDTVECESFAQSKSRLPIALGKDINGRIVTADLASMPHVLIAGSTGSGKSVAINAMIMSVLFKSTPEQVRMILVDPKRVELGMYEGIPHLFTPIITEAKLAANALRNAVKEMERRLKLLAANHVRNIDQFNKLFEHGSEYLFEDVNQEPLPYIMIIIDELADLMMLDRANVEEAITRLAQMARAVGIHLVLATQRPSVDVITGLIKANVPTRMSFRLATKVDSRTIIDSNGAESLLGRGDMLFLPPGTSRLQRVHAPFVTEKEISAVTDFWRKQGEAEYAEGFLEGPKEDKSNSGEGSANEGDDNDPMFDDAVRLVFEFGKASTSLLQRRLRIGYGRAAHLIDLMEKDGLVGPADGSKPREILKQPGYFAELDGALR